MVFHTIPLQQGHRQDTLSDTFWLMTFFESASLIGGQVLANWLVGSNVEKGIASPSMVSTFLGIVGIICVTRGWTENPQIALKDYRTSFFTYICGGKNFVLSDGSFIIYIEQIYSACTFSLGLFISSY